MKFKPGKLSLLIFILGDSKAISIIKFNYKLEFNYYNENNLNKNLFMK